MKENNDYESLIEEAYTYLGYDQRTIKLQLERGSITQDGIDKIKADIEAEKQRWQR